MPSLRSLFSATWPRSPSPWSAVLAERAPLLQVAFYLGYRPLGGLARGLAELAAGAALPPHIPVLVEGLLGGPALGVLPIAGQPPVGELVAQLVLGLDELVDVPEDLLVVHVTYRRTPAISAPTRQRAPQPHAAQPGVFQPAGSRPRSGLPRGRWLAGRRRTAEVARIPETGESGKHE